MNALRPGREGASMQTTTQIMQKVEEIGAMAGFQLSHHPSIPDMIVIPYNMGNGRTQTVYVHFCGKTPEDQDLICFMSPCQAVKKGLLKGLNRDQAIDLLRRNGQLVVGSFAVQDFGGTDILVVRSTQIVDTMEVEEFRFHANFVAIIADRYEQEKGTDVF
jgi:hypothetical protein